MKRMEETLCDWITTSEVGMIADVLIKFFQTLDSLHKEYGFVHGDMHGENIMLRDNKAVLIDMGFSCREQTRSLKPIWPPLTRFCQNGRKGAPHPPLIRQRSRGWVCGGSHLTSRLGLGYLTSMPKRQGAPRVFMGDPTVGPPWPMSQAPSLLS